MTTIQLANIHDSDVIKAVYMDAFPEKEAVQICILANKLLHEESKPEIFTLIAKAGDETVGAISLSPVKTSTEFEWQGYILAPLGVKTVFQKQGVASMLIDKGVAILTEHAVSMLFVYGDPEFYGKFGFDRKLARQYIPPFKLQFPFGWQALELNQRVEVKLPAKIACVASLMHPSFW